MRNLSDQHVSVDGREPVGVTPADDWDFDALNAEADERRKARGSTGGLDAIVSAAAGEPVRLVPTGVPVEDPATFAAPPRGITF